MIKEAIARGEGITGAALAKFLGRKHRSEVKDAVERGTFPQWSQGKDPDGYSWRWEGEGRDRRYYRMEP